MPACPLLYTQLGISWLQQLQNAAQKQKQNKQQQQQKQKAKDKQKQKQKKLLFLTDTTVTHYFVLLRGITFYLLARSH